MTRVHVVDNPAYADLTVQIVLTPGLADLLVYRNDSYKSTAHFETVWTFVTERDLAHTSVYFVPRDRGGAHLRVAFVTSQGLSGWVRPHRLKGRLNRVPHKPAYA